MTETPREYKKRVDEQRVKMRKNRDKLIECIQEYELVDEKYKATTKQEILVNFEKNEKAEKGSELYLKIGEELSNIDLKYKELEELKSRLLTKKHDKEEFEKNIREQKIDGSDETTLNIQMNKMKQDSLELKNKEKEINEIEKDIINRENEIKEIEKNYGKKNEIIGEITENIGEFYDIKAEDKHITQTQKQKKEKWKDLEEYRKETLRHLRKLDRSRCEIIKLLDNGVGIDEDMKEKIKQNITKVFFEYYDGQEGSLKMKSANYMKKREKIARSTGFGLKGYIGSYIVGGKLLEQRINSDGKQCMIWGGEQQGAFFDYVIYEKEILGKPCFEAKKDGKICVMWGDKQCSDRFDENYIKIEYEGGKLVCGGRKDGKWCETGTEIGCARKQKKNISKISNIQEVKEIGGKTFIISNIKNSNKKLVMRGDKKLGTGFDDVGNLQEIGGKPVFKAQKDGKYCIMWGDKQCGDWFHHIGKILDIGGKPCFSTKKDGKRFVMLGTEQYSEGFDDIKNIRKIGGKPCYIVKKDGKQCMMRGNKQISNLFYIVGDPQEIGGKPCFKVYNGVQECVMWGNEKLGDYSDSIVGLQEIGGKPCFGIIQGRKQCIMWGNEQLGNVSEFFGDIQNIGGKPAYMTYKNGKYIIKWGNEQLGDCIDFLSEHKIEGIGGKPYYQGIIHGKQCTIRGNEQYSGWVGKIINSKKIGGKTAFRAYKDGKLVAMRGNENCYIGSESYSEIKEFLGKPCFYIDKNGNGCIIRGNKQIGEWHDGEYIGVIFDNDELLKEFINTHTNEGQISNKGNLETIKNKRENVILERYKKKLNRDELTKFIKNLDNVDINCKKKLEEKIMQSFIDGYIKVTSTNEYKDLDKKYRDLKKTKNESDKHIKYEKEENELRTQIAKIDQQLLEIGNSALDIEDGSRLKKGKLKKTKAVWAVLENLQKESINTIYNIKKDWGELIIKYYKHLIQYGGKSKIPTIKPDNLFEGISLIENFDQNEVTALKLYKEKYLRAIEDRKEYMKKLTKIINERDFGISNEVKNEVIETLEKAAMDIIKNLGKIDGGDDLIQMANDLEEYLKNNLENILKQISNLEENIATKEEEIRLLQEEEKGISMDDLMKIREEEFHKNKELVKLKEELKVIKTELNEKYKRLNGMTYDEFIKQEKNKSDTEG